MDKNKMSIKLSHFFVGNKKHGMDCILFGTNKKCVFIGIYINDVL